MIAEPWIAVAWLAWVVGFAALTLAVAASSVRLRRARKAEQIRSAFAEARTQLVHAGVVGEVDPNSPAYRAFYFLHTTMMRRNDQYDELWGALVVGVARVQVNRSPSELGEEVAQWTGHAHRAAVLTRDAIAQMLVEYSMLLRVAVWVHGRLRGVFGGNGQDPIERIERIEERHNPDRAQVRAFLAPLGGPSALVA